MNKKIRWFTFVELVIVVAIISILSTIWFMSYSWYSSKARDTNRVSQVWGIYSALEAYRVKWFLPEPTDNIQIKSNWTLIWYQWYAWESVLSKIWYQDAWKDPSDDKYFTYYLSIDMRNEQLLALLENDPKDNKETTSLMNTEKWIVNNYWLLDLKDENYLLSYWITVKYSSAFNSQFLFLPKTYATDYTIRFPITYWRKLGILVDSANNPVQELTAIKSTWLDLTTTTTFYKAILDTKTSSWYYYWTWIILAKSLPNASCKRIIESWQNVWDWIYTINLNWTNISVYCDMTTDWGWWTMVHKTTNNQTDLAWDLTTSEWIPDWVDNWEYRLSINYWKLLSTEKAMAKNIRVDNLSWNDIETWTINSISTSSVTFSQPDIYYIFNWWWAQNNCTSWSNYWNWSCCARCINYDNSSTYWIPDNSPMLTVWITSYTWSSIEWAWWTSDATMHRLSKMWIFLK